VPLQVPPRMRARLDEYETYHTQRANELCHWLGIPLIIAGAASLLGAIPILPEWSITATEVVLAGITLFYVTEARVLGVVTALGMILIAAVGRFVPVIGGLGLFLIGWGLQLVGHSVFEKRSPAFLGNLVHLLIGPAWLVERGVRYSTRWEMRSRPPT